jgi:hypothetical protein
MYVVEKPYALFPGYRDYLQAYKWGKLSFASMIEDVHTPLAYQNQ